MVFGRQLDHESGALMNGSSVHLKGTTKNFFCYFCLVKTQQDGYMYNRRGMEGVNPCEHYDNATW